MTIQLEKNELEFVVKVIANLPTESGAYPLFVKLAEQYNSQVQPDSSDTQAVEATPAE